MQANLIISGRVPKIVKILVIRECTYKILIKAF
jgi:hypothetical protein